MNTRQLYGGRSIVVLNLLDLFEKYWTNSFTVQPSYV